ncbi:hypothetical protein DRH14_05170, partial [Candidatus Shapirobacteria bacterium]
YKHMKKWVVEALKLDKLSTINKRFKKITNPATVGTTLIVILLLSGCDTSDITQEQCEKYEGTVWFPRSRPGIILVLSNQNSNESLEVYDPRKQQSTQKPFTVEWCPDQHTSFYSRCKKLPGGDEYQVSMLSDTPTIEVVGNEPGVGVCLRAK